MKKIFVLLIFFSFLGCSVNPFIKESEEVVPWTQNKMSVYYDENVRTVFLKAKRVLEEDGETIKYESIEGSNASIETNKLRMLVCLKDEKSTELIIKANSTKNRKYAEEILKKLTIEINSVEFNKEGKPIN